MRDYTPKVNIFRQYSMNDWLAMTRSPQCTFTDRGVLHAAHELYWLDQCKGLPSDVGELAKTIGCKKTEAESMLAHTTGYEVIDDKIHWEVIERLYQRAIAMRTKNQAAGRASAKSRANKTSQNNHALGQRTFNQSLTSNQESKNISTGLGESPFKSSKEISE